MSNDSDAARIWRDREQRRAVERARIDEERTDRRRELGRLGPNPDGLPPDAEESEVPPTRISGSGRASGAVTYSAGAGAEGDHRSSAPREIGGALRPPSLQEFLQTNPMERFNILALNAQRFPELLEAARGDALLLAAIARQTEALMARVKEEVDDPLSAGAFLRDQVYRWYRDSPGEEDWSERMSDCWAGLFADSRVSGGRLQPWLNLRLGALHAQASRSGSLGGRMRDSLRRKRPAEVAVGRSTIQQIRAEVAQAILDDLTRRRRDPEGPVPLVHLSELAIRRQVATINDVLAQLFNGPETGPFIVLHPNRYPECDEVQIRPPVGNVMGAALAYSLSTGRSSRKPTGRARGPAEAGVAVAGESPDEPGTDDSEELDSSTIWEADRVDASAWRRVIKERKRERHRLDTPPKDCHGRSAYGPLRTLVLEDPEFRQSFLAVKWRGRPAGLPLLCALLQKGTLAPEVATDHEYLEAELGDLAKGDPQWHPPDHTWAIGEWTIAREGSHGEGFRFTAQRRA